MKARGALSALLALGIASGALLAACAPAAAPAGETPTPTQSAASAPTAASAPEAHGSHLAPDAFAISLEDPGHWHVLRSKKLLFKVTDTASGQGVAGLSPVVHIHRAGAKSVTERSLEKGQVQDEGQGIYSLEYTPAEIGSYAFHMVLLHEGQAFSSPGWAAEVVRDGLEGIRVEANGTSYVYQIRYNWSPGHAHASDTDKVKLVFEVLRGVQEGAAINWGQPFRNTFDHVTNAEHPEVLVRSVDGQVAEELHPVYRGRGIYEAERVFTVAEVGEAREYQVVFVFTDPYNGAEVSNAEEPYHLRVSAPH